MCEIQKQIFWRYAKEKRISFSKAILLRTKTLKILTLLINFIANGKICGVALL